VSGPVHERVARCVECPFCEEHGNFAEHRCSANYGPRTPPRDMTDEEYMAQVPPEWCPLRDGPRVVKLSPTVPR
jgi:hypothetical protein